jgi:hypothetical protein
MNYHQLASKLLYYLSVYRSTYEFILKNSETLESAQKSYL